MQKGREFPRPFLFFTQRSLALHEEVAMSHTLDQLSCGPTRTISSVPVVKYFCDAR